MIKINKKLSGIGSVRTFMKVGSCSETAFSVLDRAFDHTLPTEERASMIFAGGVVQNGYQCGLIWGSTLAAGAEAYKRFGSGPKAEAAAIHAAKKIFESFNDRFKKTDCYDLTDTDWKKKSEFVKYMLKGGTFRCFNMAAKFPPIAFREINSALDEEGVDLSETSCGCAALLAEKMGLSDEHKVMIAGFAGGIGLSGGGCGALATALWKLGLESGEGRSKADYENPVFTDLIENFLEYSEYEFECSEIVGRKFESIKDHTKYIDDGGCAKIIEALAKA